MMYMKNRTSGINVAFVPVNLSTSFTCLDMYACIQGKSLLCVLSAIRSSTKLTTSRCTWGFILVNSHTSAMFVARLLLRKTAWMFTWKNMVWADHLPIHQGVDQELKSSKCLISVWHSTLFKARVYEYSHKRRKKRRFHTCSDSTRRASNILPTHNKTKDTDVQRNSSSSEMIQMQTKIKKQPSPRQCLAGELRTWTLFRQ